MALITETEIKTYLDISGNDYDTFLDSLISTVGEDIKRICNQNIEQTTQSDAVNGTGTEYLIIPKYPVISLASLKYRSDLTYAWDNANIETIETTEYNLIKENDVDKIYYLGGFLKGISNYQINYVYGYATIPEDIKNVAKEMAAIYFKDSDVQSGSKGGVLGKQSIGESLQGVGINTTYKSLWSEWENRLRKYRRPNV